MGRLLLLAEGCIYTLKSKCSGFLHYDAFTEQVTVQTPPFTSSTPRETAYGFLGKVVVEPKQICEDGDTGTCVQEVRMELAAQLLEERSCGRLAIVTAPLCGELKPSESADANRQMRLDYLAGLLHEDAGCPKDVRFLVQTPGKRGPAGAQVDCEQYSWMRRLKLRGSQWGFLLNTDPLFTSARQVVVVPVLGGDDEDPCFELRVLDSNEQVTNYNIYQHPPAVKSDVDSTAVVIPFDTTIPQISEGKEYMTYTMTPKKADSVLVIDFSAFISGSLNIGTTFAIFKDAEVNAINATAQHITSNGDTQIVRLRTVIPVSGAGARTYRIRFGPSGGGTVFVLQSAVVNLYGSAKQAVITCDEILP